MAGFWSRRLNDEHRLVYKVTSETIVVIACCDHY
ncbi:type II toxin-antitoxin system YoeB family toxin [Hymenobacter sp. PAMC 26628]